MKRRITGNVKEIPNDESEEMQEGRRGREKRGAEREKCVMKTWESYYRTK